MIFALINQTNVSDIYGAYPINRRVKIIIKIRLIMLKFFLSQWV